MGYILWLICGWEFFALTLNRLGIHWLPTITDVVTPLRDAGPLVPMIVGAFTAWLWFHLLVEGR